MIEQRETTQNYKTVMEAELTELRSRLRSAEERNLELLQRNAENMFPGQQPRKTIIPDEESNELTVVGDFLQRPKRYHSNLRDHSERWLLFR